MEGFPGIPDAHLRGTVLSRSTAPEPLTALQTASVWEAEYSSVERMAAGSTPVTLVVNDATRPPSHPMLAPLERILSGRVRVLFATGTHRPVTPGERDDLLGGLFSDAPWESSDCDRADMASIGITSRGTPVKLHPWVVDGSPVISVNSVEPHYFAGYTGGRKSFLPGIASRETVIANHFLACRPGAGPGRLDDNPVHLDMMEALDLLLERTEIVQGNGVMQMGRLVEAFAGGCAESFLSAVRACSALSTVMAGKGSKVVVVHPGEPLHVSLYQAEKAIYNCQHMVDEDGVIMLVSPCHEGLGASHLERAFHSSMDPGWSEPTRETYRLGDHSIVRLRQMRRRMRIALASGLPRSLVESMGIEPVDDPVEWLDRQDCAAPLFIPDAGFIVPVREG
jgi:lactate racemase